jgi:oxygen-dependent protoporphyrinogen oxidase
MTDVVVIGGGVSGLAAAHELSCAGHEVVVLERQVRVGGNAISERIGGFLMEHGPSSISDPEELVTSWSTRLRLDDERVDLGSRVRRRYLVKDGGLSGIAVHPLGMFTSGYLSRAARLRMLAEPLRRRGARSAEETVAEFFARRFGRDFLDRVVDPLVGGMFAGIPEELSMAAAFPRMIEMERRHGSIVRAAMTAARKGHRMPGRKLFSWRDGIATLPAALATRLGPAIRTGVAVRRVTPESGGFRIDAGASGSLHARAVIIATQPHVAAALLEPFEPVAADALWSISAPPLAVVFMGYRREQIDHPLDGLGYLGARCEGRAVNGALFHSTMFAGRAPEGHVALSGYVGGARDPELARLPADELISIVGRDLEELVGARGSPLLARVRQWPRGLPQYGPDHAETVSACTDMEQRWPGLSVTGNFRGGVSVAACVGQARATASKLNEFLSPDGSIRPTSPHELVKPGSR